MPTSWSAIWQTYPAMAYGYSLTDQLTSITYPSGRTVTYMLDGAGRVYDDTGNITKTPTANQTIGYDRPRVSDWPCWSALRMWSE